MFLPPVASPVGSGADDGRGCRTRHSIDSRPQPLSEERPTRVRRGRDRQDCTATGARRHEHHPHRQPAGSATRKPPRPGAIGGVSPLGVRQVVFATYAGVATLIPQCPPGAGWTGMVPPRRVCKEAADAKAHDRGGGPAHHPAGGDAGAGRRRRQHQEAAQRRDRRRHPRTRAGAPADRQPERRHPRLRARPATTRRPTTSQTGSSTAGYEVHAAGVHASRSSGSSPPRRCRRSRRRRPTTRPATLRVLRQRRRHRRRSCRPTTS